MAESVLPLSIIFGLLMALMIVVRRRKPPTMTENVYGQPGQRFGPAHIPQHLAEPQHTDVLKESDRCDGCGARAYVRLVFANTSTVDLCAHHYRSADQGEIERLAIDILDERFKLEKAVGR